MTTKPTLQPKWTFTNPSQSTVSVEPDASKKITGWVPGEKPPAQQMNWLFQNLSDWVAHLNNVGILEWDAATTYQLGSFVSDLAGNFYVSISASNLNFVVTNTAKWRKITSGKNVVIVDPSSTPTITLTQADSGKTYIIRSSLGAVLFNLPTAVLNFSFSVKDGDGQFSTNACTLDPPGAVQVEGLAANYLLEADFGDWSFFCDGTNYFKG
jgi:hypothetical protein